jgi:Fe-S cluster biogenesis protein NfuA
VVVSLDVRARETPNPNGRLYLCTRELAEGARYFVHGAQGLPDLPSRLLEIEGVHTVLLRDSTVTVERTPDTPWPVLDAKVDAALRHHFLLCGHELDRAELQTHDDPLEKEVLAVLEERILPAIHRDGGDLQLVGITNGVVQVSMQGACRSCPASSATLQQGVERTLVQAFPGQITRVEQI